MRSAGDRFRTALLVIEEAVAGAGALGVEGGVLTEGAAALMEEAGLADAAAATEAERTYVLGHGSERLVYQAMESLEVLNFEHASDSDPGETAG